MHPHATAAGSPERPITDRPVTVDGGLLRPVVAALYEDAGLRSEDAAAAAEAMVRTDERGHHTHGVRLLPRYLEWLANGTIRAAAQPSILRETPATALVDGNNGFGAVVALQACEIAARKAREVGGATVLVRRGSHFGAAGTFSLWLAERGFVGLVAANTAPVVGAPGSRVPVIGTQPISLCAPAPDEHGPVMLDMALSVVAANAILQAHERGESIPEGWLNGSDGRPTTDPGALLEGGALVPIAGYKGYGLGIVVEILAAVLSGAGMGYQQVESFQTDEPPDVGYWISAFDIEAFMPLDEFKARLAGLRGHVRSVPTVDGASPLMLPGEPEWRHEVEARERGLELEADLWQALHDVAAHYDLLEPLMASVRS
jgi:LDH2 family malate/lactate/ureidoglycolate dehydrogenase